MPNNTITQQMMAEVARLASEENVSTEVIYEVARLARRQGLTSGQQLRQALEEGQLTRGQRVDLLLDIGQIKPENFSLLTRMTLALGTPTAGVIGNSLIVGVGTYTCSSSIARYPLATTTQTKVCYALSAAFSSTAIVSGGIAAASRSCHISAPAALSEAFGIAFLRLGNELHAIALQMEGQPIPPHLQRFMNKNIRPRQPRSFDYDGLSFVMPGKFSSTFISTIPFETIGKVIGGGLTIYGYYRFSKIIYSYGQKLINKYKKYKQSREDRKTKQLLYTQAQYLVTYLYFHPVSVRKRKIQRFLLSTNSFYWGLP